MMANPIRPEIRRRTLAGSGTGSGSHCPDTMQPVVSGQSPIKASLLKKIELEGSKPVIRKSNWSSLSIKSIPPGEMLHPGKSNAAGGPEQPPGFRHAAVKLLSDANPP